MRASKEEKIREKLLFEENLKKAESGDEKAQDLVGMCYLKGKGGAKKNYDEAAKWLHWTAEQKNIGARNALISLFDTVLRSQSDAVTFYTGIIVLLSKFRKEEYEAHSNFERILNPFNALAVTKPLKFAELLRAESPENITFILKSLMPKARAALKAQEKNAWLFPTTATSAVTPPIVARTETKSIPPEKPEHSSLPIPSAPEPLPGQLRFDTASSSSSSLFREEKKPSAQPPAFNPAYEHPPFIVSLPPDAMENMTHVLEIVANSHNTADAICAANSLLDLEIATNQLEKAFSRFETLIKTLKKAEGDSNFIRTHEPEIHKRLIHFGEKAPPTYKEKIENLTKQLMDVYAVAMTKHAKR